MDKIAIELTPKSKQHLVIFLNRTQLVGTEVPVYNEIMRALIEAKPKESEPVTPQE